MTNRSRRSIEAIERQGARATRTPAEQLALLGSRPGAATAERGRLAASHPDVVAIVECPDGPADYSAPGYLGTDPSVPFVTDGFPKRRHG